MAESKISQLPLASDTTVNDNLIIARSGANYRMPLTTLFNKVPTFVGSSQTTQSLSASGVIDLVSSVTEVSTTASQVNLTLASGISGQEKHILFRNKGTANVVITPASGLGFSTITLTATSNSVILKYIGTTWVIISNYGATIA